MSGESIRRHLPPGAENARRARSRDAPPPTPRNARGGLTETERAWLSGQIAAADPVRGVQMEAPPRDPEPLAPTTPATTPAAGPASTLTIEPATTLTVEVAPPAEAPPRVAPPEIEPDAPRGTGPPSSLYRRIIACTSRGNEPSDPRMTDTSVDRGLDRSAPPEGRMPGP